MMQTEGFGNLLRDWRRRRRLTQLELAGEAGVSQRHLSFVESGRARPSREMVLRLAERLETPLRDRNALLTAAGFAPAFAERPLDAPDFAAARAAVDAILAAHAPYPALAVDRRWNLVSANAPAQALLGQVDPQLLAPPVNVLRASLHPQGLAPRIANFRDWRAHVLKRLEHEIGLAPDEGMAALLAELRAYPVPPNARPPRHDGSRFAGLAVPLALRTDAGDLAFISATTVFGTAVDVTLAELTIETFFPADEETAAALRAMAASAQPQGPR